MKLDWIPGNWRVYADDAPLTDEPLRVIPHDIRIAGPVLLKLTRLAEKDKGYVVVPDGTLLEVLP